MIRLHNFCITFNLFTERPLTKPLSSNCTIDTCDKMSEREKKDPLDQILELLANEESWHSIDEIAERTHLSETETLHIIKFLAAQRLIILDKHGQNAKTGKKTARLLRQIFEEAREISEPACPL
jgi:hypothetical protein